MTNYPKETESGGQRSPSFGIGSFLTALVLAVLIYLLVASMIRHRFFRGGHPHRIAILQTWAPGPT
jgi:hypothetical protein